MLGSSGIYCASRQAEPLRKDFVERIAQRLGSIRRPRLLRLPRPRYRYGDRHRRRWATRRPSLGRRAGAEILLHRGSEGAARGLLAEGLRDLDPRHLARSPSPLQPPPLPYSRRALPPPRRMPRAIRSSRVVTAFRDLHRRQRQLLAGFQGAAQRLHDRRPSAGRNRSTGVRPGGHHGVGQALQGALGF